MTFHETLLVFKAHKNGKGYIALCPAHGDRNPSLSLREGRDGRTLVKCFAGCSLDDIISAKGLSSNELFHTSIKTSWHIPHRNGYQGRATQQRTRATVTALAEHKKLPEAFLRELGLRDGSNGVDIALVSPEGNEVGAKPATITVDTAAEWLGISRTTCYEGVHSGSIPSIKIGRRLLVPTAALEKMLGVA